jgi:hypothetical protein
MSTFTRLGAAQDGLKTLIDASAGLSSVARYIGAPDTFADTEAIWVAIDAESTQALEITQATFQKRSEEIRLQVVARVLDTGQTLVVMRDRALVLIGEVEQAIMAAPSLGNIVFNAEPVGVRTAQAVYENGNLITAELTVSAMALLDTP